MNIAGIYGPLRAAGFDPALKPTWRLLRHHLGVFHGPVANRRAERLLLRFLERGWPDRSIEQLLGRLVERDAEQRPERARHESRLARASGWVGSAGECPASYGATTPAGQESGRLVEAACHVQVETRPMGLSSRPRGGVV